MIDIDLGLVLQGVMVAVLVGVGKVVWSTSITIATLTAEFKAHAAKDVEQFDELKRAIIRRARARRKR
jgi:hypothetical protein